MSELFDRMTDALERAIQEVVGEHEGGMVGHWVAEVETTDMSGQTGVWHFASRDIAVHQAAGLLESARMDLAAAHLVQYIAVSSGAGDDDDDFEDDDE